MGSFFSNVFVLAPENTDEAVGRVVEAISTEVLRDPGVELATEERTDRRILIGRLGGTPWIGIFDEASDQLGDDEVIERLATAAAKSIGSVALATSVHDSDLARFWLASDHVLDRVARPMEVFEELNEGPDDAWMGRPDLWQRVLPGSPGVAAIEAAWDADEVFAEERVRRLGTLLEIPEEYVTRGYAYLPEQGLDAGLTPINLRITAQEAPADPAGPRLVLFGQPRIRPVTAEDRPIADVQSLYSEAAGLQSVPPLTKDGPCELIAIAQLFGGSLDALVVVVGGNGLADGMVEFETVLAVTVADLRAGPPGAIPMRDAMVGNEQVRSARLEIRATPLPPPGSLAPAAFLAALDHSLLIIAFRGRALTDGTSTLKVAVGPADNFDLGQAVAALPIVVQRSPP